MAEIVRTRSSRETAIRLNRWVYAAAQHWILWFTVIFGTYTGLPFLAPVLMKLGLETPARIIYTIYSFLCHQLPQRSFFLFGEQFTYSLARIQAAWQDTADIVILRQFIGTASMGWKVAWSDRMVSMFTGILILAWIWYPQRKRLRGVRWQALLVLTMPLVIDGLTHMTSDFTNPINGFRQTNGWLAVLTNRQLSPAFYSGDAWGSFNSLMRLITGILFAAGIVLYGFPYLEAFFMDIQTRIQEKFIRAGIAL